MDLNLVQLIAVYAVPVVFAITLHEAAHGYVAKRFGDLTAYAQGRVSLNPLRHIDPFGTVVLPLILLAVSKLSGGPGILFGWAKPVPVNFSNLRHPKRDMLWVAAAGPLSNFAMALFWALMVKIGIAMSGSYFSLPLAMMGAAGVLINVIIMVLNLLPLPPLDGGRILVSLLPHRMAYGVARMEPYGFLILILLLFTGVLGYVLWPVIGLIMALVAGAFGVPLGVLVRLTNLVS
jgi:Zn-dependent protease